MHADLPTHAVKLFALWVRLVRRAPVLVLAIALLASYGAVDFTVRHMAINTSTTDMLSEELAFRRHSEARNRLFPQYRDTLTIVVEADSSAAAEQLADGLVARLRATPERFRGLFYPQGDGFFRQNGLLYLELEQLDQLNDRLARAQPLLSALHEDMSLRGLAELLVQALDQDPGQTDRLGPILGEIAATAESLETDSPKPLAWRDLMAGPAAAPSGPARVFIIARPVLDYDSFAPAAQAIDAVHRFAEALGVTGDSDLRVRITGETPMLEDELKSVEQGMGLVGLLSFGLVISLLVAALRSLRLVLATLVTLILGLVWTTFFAIAAIGELNLISVAFAVLFIGLSVDFGIHFALRYKEALDRGLESGPALEHTAAAIGGALTLTACAAALGFFSFLPTAYRGLSELGLISGVGMFVALFANLTILPAILSLLPLKPAAGRNPGAIRGSPFMSFAARHSRPVLITAGLLGLIGLATLPFARFDDDPLNLRDPDSESVATLIDLLSDPQVQPYSAIAVVDDLAQAAALSDQLEALPQVGSTLFLDDFVPGGQDDKLLVIEEMAIYLAPILGPGGARAPPSPTERRAALGALQSALNGAPGPEAVRLAAVLERLGDDEDQAAALESALLSGLPRQLERLALSLEAGPVVRADLPAELAQRYLAEAGPAMVEIRPAADLRQQDARRAFVDAVLALAPSATDGAVTITEAGRAVVEAFEEAALYSALAISLLLLAVLRSARHCLMVLSPLLLAAVLTVAVTVLFGPPFNFANVIVLPLLFGLGVAAGIHIVVRERQEHRLDLSATSTPRAVLFSALTTIGSFGSLALSSHRGTASMGLLLTISISLSMICMLIVLPALLARFSRKPI